MKPGFRIATLNVDEGLSPLQALKYEVPWGTRVNIASDSEHAPEIER